MKHLFAACIICASIAFLLSITIKLIYFSKGGRNGVNGFVRSFFRSYSIHYIMSSSALRSQYMKVSNRANIYFWISVALAIASVVLHLKSN